MGGLTFFSSRVRPPDFSTYILHCGVLGGYFLAELISSESWLLVWLWGSVLSRAVQRVDKICAKSDRVVLQTPVCVLVHLLGKSARAVEVFFLSAGESGPKPGIYILITCHMMLMSMALDDHFIFLK